MDYKYNGPNGASVLWNAGWVDPVKSAAIDNLINATMSPIADITGDLLEMAFYGTGDPRSNMTYFTTSPVVVNGTKAVVWSPWRRLGMEPWDQPSDLYVQFDVSGTDTSLWKALKVVYDLKVYDSVADFRKAWEAKEITKNPPPTTNIEFLYKNQTGPIRDLEDRLAPTVLSLDGNRFKVDIDNQYIEYLGWKFYTRFDYDVGVQFYDIKFKDERILYELSLQGERRIYCTPSEWLTYTTADAIAQYSGNNPFQASTAYMDRFYGIGSSAIKLVPGYDCPYHATYLDGSFATTGLEAVTTNSSICIFETDIGTPITRHNNGAWTQATKGSKLVVRMIATVGNYDYLSRDYILVTWMSRGKVPPIRSRGCQ